MPEMLIYAFLIVVLNVVSAYIKRLHNKILFDRLHRRIAQINIFSFALSNTIDQKTKLKAIKKSENFLVCDFHKEV